MFGTDQARAEQTAAPWVAEQLNQGQTIWVGTHQAAGLLQPFAGVTEKPIQGISIYDVSTTASSLKPGDIVMETAYGEPAGTLLTGTEKTSIRDWVVHDGMVTAWRIGP